MAGYVPAETVLVEYLTGKFPDAFVCTETPDNLEEVLPAIQVERIGGTDSVITLDVARVDVDVFAASREDARNLSEEVRSLLRNDLIGLTISGAVVADVVTVSAPAKQFWDSTTLRRFVATYEATIHCNPL